MQMREAWGRPLGQQDLPSLLAGQQGSPSLLDGQHDF